MLSLSIGLKQCGQAHRSSARECISLCHDIIIVKRITFIHIGNPNRKGHNSVFNNHKFSKNDRKIVLNFLSYNYCGFLIRNHIGKKMMVHDF